MTDQSDALRDDLSFLRRMAEEGRRGPVLGGAFIAAAGAVYGAASFFQWAIATGAIHVGKTVDDYLWWGVSALFAIIWFALFFRLRKTGRAAGNASSFAFGMAWAGSGAGILVATAAIAIAGAAMHIPAPYMMLAPVDFAFYGTTWFVIAAIARRRWMFAVALASFGASLLLAFLVGSTTEILVLGVALIATLLLPGLKLMHESADATRES